MGNTTMARHRGAGTRALLVEANVAVAAGGEGSTVCAWFRTQPGKISTSKGMMLLGFRRIRVVTVWQSRSARTYCRVSGTKFTPRSTRASFT